MISISIIVPVYNEAETIRELHERIVATMKKIGRTYEIIFVDDGSSDDTLKISRTLKPLRILSHAGNRGQVGAIDTGISHARGEIIVLLDADLQNDPAEIPLLLAKIDDGYGAVIGRRKGRKESRTRMLFSLFSNSVARCLLHVPIHDFGCGLKAYRSMYVKDFRHFGETQVFLVAIATARGAKVCEVPVTFHGRQFGAPKVRISKMIKGSLDLLSLAFFSKFSFKPFRFFGAWGLIFFILAGIFFAGFFFTGEFAASLIMGPIFIVAGIFSFMLGLIAELLFRIYYGSGAKPIHLLKEEFENKI